MDKATFFIAIFLIFFDLFHCVQKITRYALYKKAWRVMDFNLFPLVAENYNLTLFVYKPCDVVFVLF